MRLLKRFLINGALLTATSIIMRLLNVVFNVYITDKIGAAGVGLFSLVLSVYTFAVTFATSGIYLACTRLVSQELVRGSGAGVRIAMRRSVIYALCFGTAAAALLYFLSGWIAAVWLCDIRTLKSLRLLAFSLPPLAVFLGAVRLFQRGAARGYERRNEYSGTVYPFISYRRAAEYAFRERN